MMTKMVTAAIVPGLDPEVPPVGAVVVVDPGTNTNSERQEVSF